MRTRIPLLILALLLWSIPASSGAQNKQLQLDWLDNSTNEDGFKIERGPITAGPFSQIGLTAAGVKTFLNQGLTDATQFCYRVRAYNAGGDSSYTNVACAKTRATLTIAKSGNGTVVSVPAGINCGVTCAQDVIADTVVTLMAQSAVGSNFTGWGGACAGPGPCTVTMSVAQSVTANFSAIPPPDGDPSNLTIR